MESGLGEHVKIRDPLFISATVEDSNFKFGIELGVEFYLYPTVSTALIHSVKPELTE